MSSGDNNSNSLAKSLLSAVITPLSYIYSPELHNWLKRLGNVAYSCWIRRRFRQAKGVSFCRGLSMAGGHCITIGEGSGLGYNGVLQAWTCRDNATFSPSISIGRNCWIGDNFNINAINSISIGDGVLTGRYVTIIDNSHGDLSAESLALPPLLRCPVSKGPVVIGDNVWLGDKVTILAGVTIGRGAVVAANSVVTHNVEPNTCVAGCPAKPIR
ncbi:MAG: acyltransferase [Muribaculum sp.]|nr:acyltransferase [Muribaculaceae bacterium]MCM1080494.1 acyltransferase [Muribaculum sp.]